MKKERLDVKMRKILKSPQIAPFLLGAFVNLMVLSLIFLINSINVEENFTETKEELENFVMSEVIDSTNTIKTQGIAQGKYDLKISYDNNWTIEASKNSTTIVPQTIIVTVEENQIIKGFKYQTEEQYLKEFSNTKIRIIIKVLFVEAILYCVTIIIMKILMHAIIFCVSFILSIKEKILDNEIVER